ncbi:MAG: chorismate synthase [Nitrospirota bacterium]|nr:chorismate synthase [Nitrospirota bacterium]
MNKLRYFTSGESHGRALTGILEGVPSGFPLSSDDIDRDLKRRQGGYGRGGRMKIESDHAGILSGVRKGETTGAPVALLIENKDWENWQDVMRVECRGPKTGIKDARHDPVTRPRPGHADLAGALKYGHKDIRNILERSSARETAMRVALGAIAKKLLSEFDVRTGSFITRIGKVQSPETGVKSSEEQLLSMFDNAEKSPVRCPDTVAGGKMVRLIDKAKRDGNTLGGIFEVFVTGLPPGLGSHVQWDRKLDGRLAQALMSIQAIKGVEIGSGFEMAGRFGSEVMDEIFYSSPPSRSSTGRGRAGGRYGFYRKTNNAGGIEGGMTNSMPLVIRAVMKPIPTLRRPLMSVDINTKKPFEAAYERSDVCAVPAAAVVAEAMAALVVADAFLDKFGGDSRKEIMHNFSSYISYLNKF